MQLELHNLEPILLTHCLKDHLFFLKIKDYMKEEYFTNQLIAKIFTVLKAFYIKYSMVPQRETLETLFLKQFKDNSQDYINLVNSIYQNETLYDKDFIVDQTINFIKQAKIIEAIKTSYPYINEPDKFALIADNINNAVSINLDKDLGLKFTEHSVEVVTSENKPRMSTGFAQLDTTLKGGLEGGCIYTISGVYGTGKSIWLHNIATNLLIGGKYVVLYSLELYAKQVTRRLVSNYAQITQDDFMERKPELIEQFKHIKDLTNSEMYIKEYPTGTASAQDFKTHMKELIAVEGKKPDAVVVDYANLMRLNNNFIESSFERVKKIYEELRAFAQEFDVPIVTAAQVNRGGMDDKAGGTKKGQIITGANIAESFGINMTVDIHLIINQTDQERLSNITKLYVDKNRQGKTGGMMSFEINYDYLSVNEVLHSGALLV